MDWLTVAEIVGLLAGLATGIRIFWALGKWCHKKLSKIDMFNNHKEHVILNEKIDKLVVCVETLTGELITNAGTSLKDSLIRLEHSVALTSERQRARMLDSPELVYETDLAGNCIWVNRTYARAVQRGHDELMGKGWINVVSENYRDEVDEKWYESVREDREFEMRIMFATPDGAEFPVMVRSYKMRHNGETIGFLGTVILL